MPGANQATSPVDLDLSEEKTRPAEAGGFDAAAPADVEAVVARLIRWLESGQAPAGLMTADAFADLTFPRWRVQVRGGDALLSARRGFHPQPGQVRVERVDRTERGFTIEFEERWVDGGQRWYCREQIRCDLRAGAIAELSLYCTGDWDEARVAEHAAAVSLIRP